MSKAKMTLWSTLTDVDEMLVVMVWLCDPAVWSVMKNISSTFIVIKLSRFGNLHDVAAFEAFLQTIQNKMPEKLVRNNVKMEFEILWSQMRSEELFVILCTAFQPLALLRLLLIS